MKQPLELTVMMYHYIRDQGDAAEAGSGIPGLPVKSFKSQLDELSKQYTFVTWLDVYHAVKEKKPLPNAACLLTFDDGVLDHYVNVFKILRDRKLSGLFFGMARNTGKGLVLAHKIHFLLARLGLPRLQDIIWKKLDSVQRERFKRAEQKYRLKYAPVSQDGQVNVLKAVLQRDLSADVDRVLSDLFEKYVGSEDETARNYYLNTEQIREMGAGGMHFGGHSRSHPWFDWIDAAARAAEIKASAHWLGQIEPGPWAFAYPYGGASEDSPHLLKAHGFAAAFTTRAQLRHWDPYFIGRLDGEELVGERQ